jgi:hypothetical protein
MEITHRIEVLGYWPVIVALIVGLFLGSLLCRRR